MQAHFQKYLILVLLALSVKMAYAQKSRFGSYYEQRKSLFEALPDKRGEIVFVGNSITDGCEWFELLNNKHVVNRGISGDISAGVLNRLVEITRSKPAKVFLLVGINDLARGIPADTVYENICRIATQTRIQSPRTRVYIQSILPVNDSFGLFKDHTGKTLQIIDINNRLREWCLSSGDVYIDLFSKFKNADNNLLNTKYSNDGLHLLGEGYLHWANIIKPYVK